MFVPVPPQSESERLQKQVDYPPYCHKSGRSLVDLSNTTFLYAGIVFQCLSAIFTFFPWSRFMGESFAGYQAHDLEPLYDGLAGKLNLVASAALLLSWIVVMKHPSMRSLRIYALTMIGWNLALVIWLVVVYMRLHIFRSFGLTLTLTAAAGVIACFLPFLLNCRTNRSRGNAEGGPGRTHL
jgi:hypothetical protein